jgi:hypothetical protein
VFCVALRKITPFIAPVWLTIALLFIPSQVLAEERVDSANPYERAAAELKAALSTIETKLSNASAEKDPDQDADLKWQVSRFLMLYKQLADNADKHQIPPPNLDRLKAICSALDSKVLPHDLYDSINRLEKEKLRTDQEFELAEYLRKRQAMRIKAGLLLKMISASVDILVYMPAGVGAGMAGSLGSKMAGVISGINDFVMNKVIDADPNARSPFSVDLQNQKLREYYRDNRKDIDRQVGDWVSQHYFDNGKLKTLQDYADLLKKNSDARAAYVRVLHRTIMEALAKRKEFLKDLGGKQQREIDRLKKDPRYLNAKDYLGKYKAICRRLLALKPWKPKGKPPAQPQAGVIEFSQKEYVASENAGAVKVQVVRKGDISGALWVQAETTPGSAKIWEDYGPAPARLDWAGGQGGAREFTVHLRNDDIAEPREYILLKLKAPPGVKLGAIKTAKLWIEDDDKKDETQPPPQTGGPGCRSLKIRPARLTAKPGQKVDFRQSLVVTAVMEDLREIEVTRDPATKWQPVPTYTAPATSSFNIRVPIKAEYKGCRASAQLDIEYPFWSPPMSSPDQIGANALPAPLDAEKWYAMCRKSDGVVVYGKQLDVIRHIKMAGPFVGPRTARHWIDTNCPRWRCTVSGACAKEPESAPTGAKQWFVMCNLVQGRTEFANDDKTWPGKYSRMAGPYRSMVDAQDWLAANCPDKRCDSRGRCSSAPAYGGQWQVVCSRNNGEVYLTKEYNSARNWIWQERLRSRSDAEIWAQKHCPSWRCDRNGRCLKGPAPPSAGQTSTSDVLNLFDSRRQQRDQEVGSRSSTLTVETGRPGFTMEDSERDVQDNIDKITGWVKDKGDKPDKPDTPDTPHKPDEGTKPDGGDKPDKPDGGAPPPAGGGGSDTCKTNKCWYQIRATATWLDEKKRHCQRIWYFQQRMGPDYRDRLKHYDQVRKNWMKTLPNPKWTMYNIGHMEELSHQRDQFKNLPPPQQKCGSAPIP